MSHVIAAANAANANVARHPPALTTMAPGVGPEGRGERPDEPLQAGGHAPQQAGVDLGVVE